MEEDKQAKDLPSDRPSSIFIGGPAKAENILSGSINKNNENKNITLKKHHKHLLGLGF